ncbi:major tail protein [Arthrobacter phage LittleTokyo]|nr:major tail protein [Arthrobacter phage LittleTokyo]
MTVDSKNVLTGAPDQLTTGPILSAPVGTTLPTSALDTLDPAFTDGGYVSDEGLNLTPERSSESIRDWSGAKIREILTEFSASLSWTHLETSEESLKDYFGDDNVAVTAATTTNGKQLAAELKDAELPRKSRVFKIKDGTNKVLVVVPDGQVTETGEVSFTRAGAVMWPCTMTTFPDANGVHVYVYTDDGVFTAV